MRIAVLALLLAAAAAAIAAGILLRAESAGREFPRQHRAGVHVTKIEGGKVATLPVFPYQADPRAEPTITKGK